MRRAPFGTIDPGSAAIASLVPTQALRSGKRAEDTAKGCRANAAADLGRAHAPGGDFMRLRLEQSAAVWSARADLLERLEEKFRLRTGVEAAAGAA